MRNATISVLLVCAGITVAFCRPPPPKPPVPPIADAGPVDPCERWAALKSEELEEAANDQRLSITQVTRVFEGACTPFVDDGPDAAISSGLAAARNARAALVTDGG